MSKAIDFFRYLFKSTGRSIHKFFIMKNMIVKESIIERKGIEITNNLSEKIYHYLYRDPVGFLFRFKTQNIFLKYHANTSNQYCKINAKKRNETNVSDNKYLISIELVSLKFSNNVLKKIKRETVSLDKFLSDTSSKFSNTKS